MEKNYEFVKRNKFAKEFAIKNSLLVKPFGSLAVLPITSAGRSVKTTNIIAFTVLFSISPLADVLSTITPNVFAEAMLSIMFVSALISTSIIPLVDSLAMH